MPGRIGAAVVTMAVLAALDLAGALAARRYAEHRSAVFLALGCATFAFLFVVYAHGLRYAELSTITFGWVALLQLGVIGIEHRAAGATPAVDRLWVMAAILVLEGYLILGPRPA